MVLSDFTFGMCRCEIADQYLQLYILLNGGTLGIAEHPLGGLWNEIVANQEAEWLKREAEQ